MLLVTGATGLVGAHLLVQLAQTNNPIRAIYRNQNHILKTENLFKHFNQHHLFNNIEWVKADITDVPALEKAFTGVTQVYHCAALISFNEKDQNQLYKINIEGTANIVNLSLAYQVQKLCYVSSIAALGDLKENETTITEDTEWNPAKEHSDYAISKHGAEMEVWRASQEGLPVIIVNPGIIAGYGFWDNGLGPLFQQVNQHLKYYTLGTVGIVAVTDLVTLMQQLMESDLTNQQYIVVAQNITYQTLITSIAKGLGTTPPHRYANPTLTQLAWKFDKIRSLLPYTTRKLTRSMAQALHKTDLYSNQKIITQFQYPFTPIEPYLITLAQQYKADQY